MNLTSKIVKRKLATLLLISISIAAFATLGDGDKRVVHTQRKLLTDQFNHYNFKTFTLKSGYNYRGSNIFSHPNEENKFIMLNTTVTYQKGNATYILPLKKKVLLDKINFHPAAPIK